MVLTFHISCLALFGSASVSFAWRGFANDELKIVTKVVYRDVPPGLLSNLPTLPPATCTSGIKLRARIPEMLCSMLIPRHRLYPDLS